MLVHFLISPSCITVMLTGWGVAQRNPNPGKA
jgi:hypothetical protein